MSCLIKVLIRYIQYILVKKLSIYQGVYSLSYVLGTIISIITILKDVKRVDILLFILGCAASILGILSTLVESDNLSDATDTELWMIHISVAAVGLSEGIIQPLLFKKIVTRTNRPEFFIGLFYFLTSIVIVAVIPLPK